MKYLEAMALVLFFLMTFLVASRWANPHVYASEVSDSPKWVGTWATSPQLVEPNNMPPSPGLSNHTLRQIVQVSLGGSKLRLKLSNQYGNAPLTINGASLAQAGDGSATDLDPNKPVTFAGNEAVVIPPGATAISDPVDFNLLPLTKIAITLDCGSVPPALTGHPGSRTTSYIYTAAGNLAATTDHWYIITGIDILTPDDNKTAVVTLGDSITDGRGSITNQNNRWPDILAQRLQANDETAHVGVLNQGIGGNAVLYGGLGPTVYSRFSRDVLDQSGVGYVIILAGVNDIGASTATVIRVNDIIRAFQMFIDQAKEKGILVYGATLLPFGGSGYYSPQREELRQMLNDWIRTSGEFDGVIDFDLALRDPNQPLQLLPLYDDGDHLHPSVDGHKRMGEAVDLGLFEPDVSQK